MRLASEPVVNWVPLRIICMSELQCSIITLHCSAQHNILTLLGIQVESYIFSYATHPSRFFFLIWVVEIHYTYISNRQAYTFSSYCMQTEEQILTPSASSQFIPAALRTFPLTEIKPQINSELLSNYTLSLQIIKRVITLHTVHPLFGNNPQKLQVCKSMMRTTHSFHSKLIIRIFFLNEHFYSITQKHCNLLQY